MSETETCNHRWRRVYEESIIGMLCTLGWDCLECKKYVDNKELTPAGLGGVVTKAKRLVGINGGEGNCSDGSVYKEQLIDEEGNLTIIRR
jgi:hypothetical protein